MTARPRLMLLGLAAAWTAGVWASPVTPLPPPSAVPQGPGAEADPSNASAPSPRIGSDAKRPSLLPAPRLEGTEAAGQAAPGAVPLLPSPPSMTTQAAGPDAPASSPSAGHRTESPGLLPAPRSGGTETAGEAVRPAPSLLPAAPAAGEAGGEAGVAGPVPRDGKPAAAPVQSGGSRDAGVRSRLVRSLEQRPSPRPESAPPPGPSGQPAGGGARRRAVFGCPRALLTDLLAGAAEPGGAVSALAVEREVLLLCRERQAVVAEIVRLEGELRAALDASKPPGTPAAGSGDGGTAPRRVVVRLAAPEPSEERAAPAPKAAAPKPPAYAWFSILGTPGRLRAGVSDGRRVWFVREGDRLPGAVLIQRITARPPGVRVQGAGRGALPYGARPAGDGT